jgi:lysyl-tRNA synthetase class 2
MPSSVVASIHYEAEHARLTVSFTTGRIYQYYLVPPAVAASFQSALSKGAYFNTHIRDRFVCREVRAPDDAQRKRSAR